MGNKKGKSLTMGELKKKMKVSKPKEGSAKEARKNAKAVAQKAREGKIGDGGQAGLIHPNSRKAKQLMRSFTNEARKAERESVKNHKERARMMKFIWIKDAVEAEEDFAGLKCLTAEMVQSLCKKLVQRHDQEITSLREKRTMTASYRYMPEKGREKELMAFRTEELKQAESGDLEIPFVSSKNGLKALRLWDKQLSTMHTVPVTTVQVLGGLDEFSFSLGEATPDKIKQLKQKVLASHQARKANPKKSTTTATPVTTEVRKTLQASDVKSRRAGMLASARGEKTTKEGKKITSAAKAKVDKAQARAAKGAKEEGFSFEPMEE